MRKFFGTDGIRGKANVYPMTADLALKLGMACGKIFRDGNHRHRVVIGKDTRLSGYMLEPALSAGFVAMGIDVITVGPVPTPAVGILTKSMRCDVGVMISASHNPYYDNGIKLFGPDGYKLDDDIERTIEQEMSKDLSDNYVSPDKLGRVRRLEDAKGRYMEIVKSSINPRGFSKLKVVLDCANGAAYAIAPTILWELGCEVISIAVEPNGFNINENCGSTNPEKMCKAVKEHKADLGIALDGDADRITMCDEKGQLIDGDKILALIATKLAKADKLKLNGVVATVMSNLGLEQYLNSLKISMIRTKVGDRYVVDNMRKNGFNLGGEQSGHIILTDIATTGDGIVSALQILSILAEKGIPASELFDIYKPYPQELRNYLYKDNNPLELPEVRSITQEIEDQFAKNKNGRILTRKSGTEPLIRVMIEAEEYKLVKEYHEKLSKVMS